MIILSVNEIILLQEKLVEITGGSVGLRDQGLLESAIYSIDASFGDFEQYPTIEEKAARIMFALATNHPFIDGNKRIGVLSMLTMLELNDINLQYSQEELVDLGLGVAQGKYKYEEILNWIKEHIE